jgi:hypothetical protein
MHQFCFTGVSLPYSLRKALAEHPDAAFREYMEK